MEIKDSSKEKWHFRISMFKSVLRILAAVALMFKDYQSSAYLFITAELAGIAEEM